MRKFNSTPTLICTNIFSPSFLSSFCQTIHAAFGKVCKCRKYMIQRAGRIPHVHRCSCTCAAFARKFATNKADRIVSNVDGLQSHSYTHSSIASGIRIDMRFYQHRKSRRATAKLILIRKGRLYTNGKIKSVTHVIFVSQYGPKPNIVKRDSDERILVSDKKLQILSVELMHISSSYITSTVIYH